MTDSPEVQKLIRGLAKLKVDQQMKDWREGVTFGVQCSMTALTAAREASVREGDNEVIPGLDAAIAILSLSLEMTKLETGQ